MNDFILFIIAFSILIPIFLKKVRAEEVGLIENLGQFSHEVGSGLVFIIPGLQTLRKIDVSKKEVVIPADEIYTENRSSVSVEWLVFVSISDATKAIYRSKNVYVDVAEIAHEQLRSIVRTKSMDELFSSYNEIEDQLFESLRVKAGGLGLEIHRVEIRRFI